jgi:CRP-like cAMP-binding protein
VSNSSAEIPTEGPEGPGAQTLLGAGEVRYFPASSILCEEGHSTDSFFLVTAGTFVVGKHVGGRLATLWTAGPGTVLALMPAYDGRPCAVTISAVNDATVVAIPRERLLALLECEGSTNGALADLLALLAIRRLRQATNELAQSLLSALQSTDAPGRIDAIRLARVQAGGYVWLDG